MAARTPIQILIGPNGSVRSARLDALLRESGGRARLLVPSVAQARARREAFLSAEDCPGAWGMPVWSLADFARQLLEAEGLSVARLDSSFQRTLLMEQCLADLAAAGTDTYLARIARTPGLVRHLLRVINDLKQAAVEPADFAAKIETASYRSLLDDGVAAIYQRYQDALLARDLYDVPGLYWRADIAARARRPCILEGIDTLLWDGFDDFTPSEFRLLASLLAHVDRAVIGLNLDEAPDRQDRYALPLNTLRQLREHFDCQAVTCEVPEPRTCVEFAARHIFWREEPAPPEGLAANLAIVPCSDTLHELESIARRVKKLIVEGGVAPETIAVLHWNMNDLAGSLRTVFDGFGIPCQLAIARPLAETGVGRTLVNLLRNTGAWEREGILDLLTSPYLRDALWGDAGGDIGEEGLGHFVTKGTGGTPILHSDVDGIGHSVTKGTGGTPILHSDVDGIGHFVTKGTGGTSAPADLRPILLSAPLGLIDASAYYTRRAQILEGYKDWTFRLQRLRNQVERGESRDAQTILHRRPDAVAELDALLAAMQRLYELQQCLPAKGTPLAFAEAVDGFLDTLTIDCADEGEAAALDGIRGLLELLADAPAQGELRREDFLEHLAQGMEETSVSLRGTPGGVVCLSANEARNLRFAHVFAAGLMEGQVPAAPAGNSVYPEHDRDRLHEVGIPVETNQEHHARQRMLFGHVLECAGESLTLSWPLTQDSGRESSPSPFLTDVRELFPEAAGVVAPYPRADSFLPDIEGIASARDVANRALYDAPALAAGFAEHCAPCQIGAAVEADRHSAADFGPYDAVLGDPETLADIAARYGDAHEFSVAQLETYLMCPFSFYTDRILHLEDTEAPDGSITPLVRGSLLHEALQRFHTQFTGLHIGDIGLGAADEAMAAILAAVFAEHDWSDSSAPPAARAAEQAHLLTRLRRYLRIELAQDAEYGWKPAHFETAFGRTCAEDDEAPSTSEPFRMETASGPVLFTGRIDRIDRAGTAARIIDYKSGSAPGSGEITRGENIQLSVYAEAVEKHLLRGSQCAEARYLVVGKTDRREALGIGEKRWNWPAREENMKAAIARAVDGIRRGYFPPVRGGKTCHGCGQARACRHDEGRIARKSGASNRSGEVDDS